MPSIPLTRREFLAASASTAAALTLPGATAFASEFHTTLHKAMIIGPPTEATLTPLKEAGFEGVESRFVCPDKEAEGRRAVADKVGMRIHSVLRGWGEFNSEDPKKVEDSIEWARAALRTAKIYGADDILLVPCRIGGMPMPEPWEFDIEFDPKTLHASRVVKGDNSKYAAYIEAQNRATDTSRLAVEKLIPLAEELKVIIGLENVWNNLWVKPEFYKAFVTSFANPWVKSYFDIGNHVKYQPPQDWIRTLGKGMIVKLHFKDFKLNPDGHGGNFVHIRDGSIDWPDVRKALDEVDYTGWGSIEEDGLPWKEFARRFDLIADGK